jgi:hypothetical protein
MNCRLCLLAGIMIVLALTAFPSFAQSIYEPYTFTTLAGAAGSSSADGRGSTTRFGTLFGPGPASVAVDSAGNVYVADTYNGTIRKGYPAPRIINSGSGFGFNGSQFGFNLTGPAGRLVIMEASTNLLGWLPLWTNTFAGALHFSDPLGEGASHRFYRVRLPYRWAAGHDRFHGHERRRCRTLLLPRRREGITSYGVNTP